MFSAPPSPPVSNRECLRVWLAALIGLPVAMLVLAGPRLFARAFWSDEVLSWLIASDPRFDHGLAALAGGVDTNAPLLHVACHLVGGEFGHSPAVYRSLAAFGISLALAGLYFLLRRSLAAGAAVLGSLTLLAFPLVITHATEARFYSLMLAAGVWSAYWLCRRAERATTANAVATALAAAALCGVHYFGAIALGCLILCVASTRRSWGRRLDATYPALAGLAVAVALLPLLLAQRAAMVGGGGTWVPDDFWLNLRTTLALATPGGAVGSIALLAGVAIVVVGRASVVDALRRLPAVWRAFPLYAAALLAFDRVVQPVLVPRYFILLLPALAAATATLAGTLPPRIVRSLSVALLAVIAGEMVSLRWRIAAPSARSALGVLASVSDGGDEPIVSDWLGFALAVWHARPDARDAVTYLADHRLAEPGFDPAIRYERKMAEQVRLFYGLPREVHLDDVGRLGRFVLLSEFPETVGRRFPGFAVRQRGEVTFEMTRIGSASAARSDGD